MATMKRNFLYRGKHLFARCNVSFLSQTVGANRLKYVVT